jgi:hypothetical protein
MYNVKIRNCSLLLWDCAVQLVSTDDLAWTCSFHHLMACVDRPRILFQNIHDHVRTRPYGVRTQTTLRILTTVTTSNPVPKIIKNSNVDGNSTSGKLNYIIAVHCFAQYSISHTFSHQLCTLFYNMPQKTEETNHFQYKYTFYIRTTYDEFQSSTTIIPQGNLTSDWK